MNTRTDPSALFGSIVTAIGAILALLVAFGVDLTETQREAILGTAVALGPLVTALLIRRHAYAPATVERRVRAAQQASNATEEPYRA